MNADHRRFFGSGLAAQAVRAALADAQVVRIATAFFEPSGWDILADILERKEVLLLVGREEGAADKASDLLREFFEEVQRGALYAAPTVLKKLLAALRNGKLAIRISGHKVLGSVDIRYLYHHAKLYIADAAQAVVTSANFTRNGLQVSREAGYLVTDKVDVAYFVATFDKYFADAFSLTAVFVEALEELLDLHTPAEVYYRSLLEIYGMPEGSFAASLPAPAHYQTPVISRLVRGITDFGGAFLIASTGLGKTVIAAHTVAILRARESINAAMVFAPAGLREMWKYSMRAARVSSQEYSYMSLSSNDWKKHKQSRILDDELQHDLSQMLIILDESHHMRNDAEDIEDMRLSHRRLLQAVKKGARILLLTATPYSRGVDDINNQLRLIPKRAVKGEFFETDKHWRVDRPAELSELAPCTVLTAPTVVRYFSESDAKGRRFVRFGKERCLFFPERIHLKTVEFQNVYNPILKELKASNLLRRSAPSEYAASIFGDSVLAGKADPLFEARLMHQFCSSGAQVKATLENMNKEGGYERMRFEAQAELTLLTDALLDKIATMHDTKLMKLQEIISAYAQEKIVIFCIYKETAKELFQFLQKSFSQLNIGTTVDVKPEELENVLDYFAPIANDCITVDAEITEHTERILEKKIDILIASEAISEGFNLQDARILINYDLPWSVLQLAQRMGRLMRPWHEVRELLIFNFLPDTMFDKELKHGNAWRERLHRRNEEQQSFARLPVLMPNDNDAIRLEALGDVLQQFETVDLELNEAMDFIANATNVGTSSVLDDLARISADESERLLKLRAGFRSRIAKNLGDPALYLLIALRASVFPAVFDEKGALMLPPHEVSRPLELLRRRRDDEIYRDDFDPAALDAFQEKCLAAWLTSFGETREKVRVICALHFTA